MNFCKKCGAQLYGNVRFCPNCGTAVEKEWESTNDQKESWKDSFSEAFSKIGNTPDTTSRFSSDDIQQNRTICFFAYLSWLVLVPILSNPNSKYARFHSNQGLVLFLCCLAISVIKGGLKLTAGFFLSFIPFWGTLVDILFGIAGAGTIVLAIMGLINVYHNRAKELPIIGHIRLLK